MPPKKQEKENEKGKNSQNDQIQQDHELFLQAFEKPTQIYRFLRARFLNSPIFLQRTLTYMKHRMSRNHKPRRNFKVDSLLQKVRTNQEKSEKVTMGHMNLSFTGFYDATTKVLSETVTVELMLLSIHHKKKKDLSAPIAQVTLGSTHVPWNPSSSKAPATALPSISISADAFSPTNGHLVKSYVLLLRVTSNRLANGETASEQSCEEPPTKQLRSCKGSSAESQPRIFGAEMVVYDSKNRCLLTDGQYEILLEEVTAKLGKPNHKYCTWESLMEDNDTVGDYDSLEKGPLLKFSLNWSSKPVSGQIVVPMNLDSNGHLTPLRSKGGNSPRDAHALGEGTELNRMEEPNRKRMRIFYNFQYNNNTRQQTEAREDFHCPWCSLSCRHLYSLLKHLKLCHGRLVFAYVPLAKGARIDVTINESYDGSYAGNPHDLHSQPPWQAFSRGGPVQRNSVTNVMVCRPKRYPPSLSEFLEPEDNDYDGTRPYISGHNRMYHHTVGCLPVQPQEIDADSEGENDPEWLRIKTQLMIDEFTDVNEGEKEVMKMWNLHIMRYGFVGDCQIPLACAMFIENHGKEIVRKKLYRNLVLHMCGMYDFGLIGASTVYKTLVHLQYVIGEDAMRQAIYRQSQETASHSSTGTGTQPN